MTMPGTPFVYYGEEIGMRGSKPDEDIRRPMQWTDGEFAGFSTAQPWRAAWPDASTVNVAVQTGDPDSLLSHYRDLIALRQSDPALLRGGYGRVQTGTDKVLAYIRTDPEGERAVLVLANVTEKPVSTYLLRGRGLGVPSRARAMDLMTGAELEAAGVNMRGGLSGYRPIRELAPKTAYLIELRPPADNR